MKLQKYLDWLKRAKDSCQLYVIWMLIYNLEYISPQYLGTGPNNSNVICEPHGPGSQANEGKDDERILALP